MCQSSEAALRGWGTPRIGQSLNRDSPGLSQFQGFLRNVPEEEGEARDCSCRKER